MAQILGVEKRKTKNNTFIKLQVVTILNGKIRKVTFDISCSWNSNNYRINCSNS